MQRRIYENGARAIDWLCSAFGFEVRLAIEGAGGRIEHSELAAGDGLIFVGDAGGKPSRPGGLPTQSPCSLNGVNTQMICVFIDDVGLARPARPARPQRRCHHPGRTQHHGLR